MISMGWVRVIIRNDEIAAASAAALVDGLSKAYREAGTPAGVELYHAATVYGPHIYYLSAKAGEIAKDIVALYRDVAYVQTLDVAGLKAILL